jgi:hypothetical protein
MDDDDDDDVLCILYIYISPSRLVFNTLLKCEDVFVGAKGSFVCVCHTYIGHNLHPPLSIYIYVSTPPSL